MDQRWVFLDYLLKEEFSACEEILAGGYNIQSVYNNGDTALHLAVFNNIPTAVDFLIDYQIDINAQNTDGNTALMIAITERFPNLVQLLLGRNANENIYNIVGETPLFNSILTNQRQIFQLLLERGNINFTHKDHNQRDVVFYAAFQDIFYLEKLKEYMTPVEYKDALGETALFLAVEEENLTVVKSLVHQGFSLDVVNTQGVGLLFWPAFNGDFKTIDYLLDKGLNINYADQYGNTPIFWSIGSNNPHILRHLVEKGADPCVVNKDGNNILIEAVLSRSYRMVEEVLKVKCYNRDITSQKNYEGMDAVDIAIKLNLIEILSLLLSARSSFGTDFWSHPKSRDYYYDIQIVTKSPEYPKRYFK